MGEPCALTGVQPIDWPGTFTCQVNRSTEWVSKLDLPHGRQGR